MSDNNDVFEGQGITFMSSNMASTAPSATPPAITAPSIDMANAPANQIPAVPASSLQPNSPAPDAGAIPAPPDPSQIAANLAGNGNLGLGAGGAAPPHPSANPPDEGDDQDVFAKFGVQQPTVTQINTNAFNAGVPVPAVTAPATGDQVGFKDELMPIGSNRVGAPPVDAAAYAQNQQQQMLTLAYSRFSPAQIASWQNNPIGFKEAFQMLSPSQYLPGGGIKQLYNAEQLLSIGNKMKNGEQVTPEEQGQLNDYLNQQIEMSVRKFSWGGNIAYVGGQIPAFVAEFAAAGGVGKLAGTAAIKGAEELGAQGIIKAATGAATAAATTTALMPAQYAAKYGERQLNANMAVTDKGQLVLQQSTESPATSALLAFAHTGADVTAQLMAPGIGKYIVDPATKLVSTPVIAAAKNISPEVTDQLYQAWKAIQPSATVSQMFTNAGWAGMVEQLGANRVQQVLNSTIDYGSSKNESFDQYLDALTPSKDQLMVEGGLIAIAGGIHTSAGIAGALLRSKGIPAPQAAEAVDNMSAMEKDAFVSQNLQMPQSLMPSLLPETRGAGAQYHGTSTPIDELDNYNYGSLNYYGQGLYTTDAMDVAKGYSAKGRGAQPTIYHVEAPEDQRARLMDMEKSLDQGTIDQIKLPPEMRQAYDYLKQEGGVKQPNLRQVYDETRDQMTGEMNSADSVQEVFDSARYNMEQAGYTGLKHQGGLRTKTAPHNVEIYWNADQTNLTNLTAQQKAEVTAQTPGDVNGQMAADDLLAAKKAPTASQSAAANITANQTAATAAVNPAPIQGSQSGFNAHWQTWKNEVWPSLYAETINDMQPIENLTAKARAAGATVPEGQDTALTVSFTKSTPEWIKRNWTQNTTTWDANGNQVITGKGLKPIYDDFDNMFLTTEGSRDTRHQDFQDYQLARTFMEDQQKGLSDVSPKDQQFAADTMTKLAQKYGQNIKYFGTFADEVGDWRNRVLHNLVTSGIKTQEWYDTTVAARNHYAPTSREVQEEFPQSIGGKAIAKNVSPSSIGSLKERGGSSLDVKDVFQQDLKNSAIIMQKSAVNKLRADIAKFASYYPDDVKVSRPAIIREGVEHTYDPKLRQKLEEVAKFMGVDTERFGTNDIKINGGEKALGAFDPNSDKILLARGTKESILTHEVGHALDKKLGLDKVLLGNPAMKAELQKLAEDRLNAQIALRKNASGQTEFDEQVQRAPAKYMQYLKNDKEVLANFFDAWVNSPEQVEKTAPKAKTAFEKLIDDNPQLSMLRDVKPSTAVASEQIERPLMDMKGPKGSIPVYLDGKRNYMELSKPLEKAFSAMSPMEMGMVERFVGGIFRGSKRLLQFGATSSPDFMLRHFYRAVFSSYLNTKGNSPVDFFRHAAIDIPKSIFAVIGKTDLYHEWASSSGALSTHLDITDKGLAKAEKDMYSTDSMTKWLNPIHLFNTVKEVSDYAPRVAAYEKMKRDGNSDLAAGIMSLEATGNYIRHGSLTQRINQYAPFFNDMVQGGDRFVRSLLRQSPAAFAARAVATITMPQLLLTGYYLYAADDKTRQEYLQIPDWRRATFMNVKIGDTWIPLPRAFAAGHVFGALPEQVMLHLYQGNQPELKNFWLRQIAETATSVSPVFDWTRAINPIMKAAIENMTNYSFFTQRPVFSGDMQKTAPANQFNQYSSETAKLIGKMFDISPSKIDNTVYDMAAKAGRFALQLSDMGINEARKLAGQPVNEKGTRATDNPLYGGLIEQTPSGTGTGSFQEFEEHLHDAQQANNTYKEATGADQAHYMQNNARTLGAYPPINAANTQVNHLLHQIRTINQNTNIPGDDKTVQTNRLQDQITHIVEGANLRYRAQTGTGTAQQGVQQ